MNLKNSNPDILGGWKEDIQMEKKKIKVLLSNYEIKKIKIF